MTKDGEKTRAGKAAFVVLVLLLAGNGFNCVKNPMAPVAPSWNVDVTFPVGSKTVSVEDLIKKDSTALVADASNRLSYASTMTLSPTSVGDRLFIDPASASSQIELGAFAVTIPSVRTGVNLPALQPGVTTYIPAMTMSFPDVRTDLSSSSSATFRSGTITLTISNNLPVEIVAADSLFLVDDAGNIEAGFDFTQSPILPAHSSSASASLAGKTLGAGFNIKNIVFSTPGSKGQVAVPTDSMLVLNASFSDLVASQAEVDKLPAQRLTDNDNTTIALDDSTMLKEVSIESGRLRFDFSNRIEIPVLFKFRILELYRSNGSASAQYEDSIYLPASGSNSYELNLAGCDLKSSTASLISSLGLVSSVILPQDVNQTVTVHDTDKVHIGMTTLEEIVADSVVGRVKPTWFDVNSTVAVNKGSFPSKLTASLNIPSASLTLNLASNIGYPADLYLTLSATNSTGQTATLDIPSSQRRILPGTGTIVFDEQAVGAFLSQFSASLPDSIRISGKVLLNPSDCYAASDLGSVGKNSTIGGDVSLSIPLTMGIAQATYRDTTGFGKYTDGSEKKPAEDQLKNVGSAKLHVEIQNGLPVGVKVTVHILDTLHQCLLTLPQSGGTFDVASASVDASGYASAATATSFVVDLNHAEAQQYIPAKYVDYSVEVASGDGSSTVTFRTTDQVLVRLWTECSYEVNQ